MFDLIFLIVILNLLYRGFGLETLFGFFIGFICCKVVGPSRKKVIILIKEPIRELVCGIIDKFENILDENDITIPDPDRDSDNESEARIFGQTYYRLEEEITDLIKESGVIHPVEFD